MDSSDFQNLLDLDYPVDQGSIDDHSNSWSRWENYQSPQWTDNWRADGGETFQCPAFDLNDPVDITEHTLDGKGFLQMSSSLTFDF